MEKILLDTDIGSDIDDAVCLAYLLSQPECELVGITTVSGEPDLRARMASALCYAAGKRVPIFVGAPKPLLRENLQPKCPQYSAIGTQKHDTAFPPVPAIEFMRKTIYENPGEITLLAIGPFTNVGLLFAADPAVSALLKRVVVMGGVFKSGGYPEWNAMNDPHATAILYSATAPVHRSVGLDVTRQVQMGADEVRERFSASALLRPVLDFAEVWFKHTEELTFHDPLAAVCIFEPILKFERGTVDVELISPNFAGHTAFKPDENGVHEVAVDVTPQKFFEAFFKVFEP